MGNDKEYTSSTTWQLAVGKDAEVRKIADFFGMEYHTDENDKAKINHTLVTAVNRPVRQGDADDLRVNSWTTAQLLSELKTAADSMDAMPSNMPMAK